MVKKRAGQTWPGTQLVTAIHNCVRHNYAGSGATSLQDTAQVHASEWLRGISDDMHKHACCHSQQRVQKAEVLSGALQTICAEVEALMVCVWGGGGLLLSLQP